MCGAINRDGSVAVPPQYDWVDKFHEERARVRRAGRYGYVDTTGRLVIEPRYEIAGAFWRGSAEVDVDGKSALIDPEGREVLGATFRARTSLHEGRVLGGRHAPLYRSAGHGGTGELR